LLIIHWLLSLAMFVLLAVLWIVQPSREEVLWFLPKRFWIPALVCAAIVYLAIAVWSLATLIKKKGRREDRGFIVVETSDSGKVRLSIPVIEQMVRQAAGTVEGVRDIKPTIVGLDDSIDVMLNATMDNGVHVPTVTVNLQRAIRQYVELNCGISVNAVTVSILSVTRPQASEHRLRKPILPPPVAPKAQDGPLVSPAEAQKETTAEDMPETFTETYAEPAVETAEAVVSEDLPDDTEIKDAFEDVQEDRLNDQESIEE